MSDIETADVETRGISRRAMIAGTAGTAAAMWAAPAITSLGASAGAASTACNGSDWNCGDAITQCGTGSQGQLCVCDTDSSGNTYCWEDFSCGSTANCASNADCPSGQACTTNCCGTTCAPTCGNPAGTTTLSGKSATGKVY